MSDVTIKNESVPAHLQGKTKTARFGNIDSTDQVIPRIKLLSAVHPEVTKYDNARPGEFWHTTLEESLGKKIVGVPIVIRKTHVLWAPRGDERGILARSRDGVHWDPPEGEFQIQYPGNKTTYTWKLAPTVAESRLDQFGSSRTDDPGSLPASTLTYEILWWFPQIKHIGPSIILNSRGSLKVCQNLITKIEAIPYDHFEQLYSITSDVAKGPQNQPYYNYMYTNLGFVDDDISVRAGDYYRHFKDVAFRASDERDDSSDTPGAARKPLQTSNRSPDSKF